jgi:ubiquinone biosynthesis protein UbiJ
MIQDITFDILETALNNYVFLDNATHDRLKSLHDKIAKFEFKNTPFVIFLHFCNDHIYLLRYFAGSPHVTIQASVFTFIRTWQQNKQKKTVPLKEFTIIGDVQLAQAINDMLGHCDIDWEAQLSKIIGELLAHQLGNATRNIKNWFQQTQQTLMQNTTEYLQEEKRWLPTVAETSDFFSDVDILRNDVERAQARINRLVKIDSFRNLK